MHSSSRRGFTIIELLIVIAVIGIIGVVSVLGLGRYRSGESVESAATEIVAAIRSVQQRSVTQENGQGWGIRFINATSGVPFLGTQSYTIFRGPTFATGTPDRTFTLRSNVRFSDPVASSTKDLTFAAITGKPPALFSISLTSPGNSPFTKQITVAASGAISVQ